jgi:hypothetical protein
MESNVALPTGLDFVDPQGWTWGRFDALAETEATGEGQWPGRILADKKQRAALVKTVLDTLDWVLQGVPDPKPKKRRHLRKNADARLLQGMKVGCQKLSTKVAIKKASKKASAGLLERDEIIWNAVCKW